MSHSPLAEHATVLVATPPAEAVQYALDLVGPHLRADRSLFYMRDPAQGCGRIAFV